MYCILEFLMNIENALNSPKTKYFLPYYVFNSLIDLILGLKHGDRVYEGTGYMRGQDI